MAMSTEKPSKETKERWHKDPSNWKLGTFYYNKEDPSLFPPKRNKYLGWTINLANPYSILALVILVFVVTLIALFLK